MHVRRLKIGLLTLLTAVALVVFVVITCGGYQSAPVSTEWSVTEVPLFPFAANQLIQAERPGVLIFEGYDPVGDSFSFWRVNARGGGPTRHAPHPKGATKEDRLHLAGNGECYAIRRDDTIDHLRPDGSRERIGTAPGWTRHARPMKDGVALVYDHEGVVLCLRGAKVYQAALPPVVPRLLFQVHCWENTLTVTGTNTVVRLPMTFEGDALQFGEPLRFLSDDTPLTAVDPSTGELAIMNRLGGKLRVVPGDPTRATEYKISTPRGSFSDCAFTSTSFYFSLSTTRWGGLDMRPHEDVYAFRLADGSTHRLTALDSFSITLMACRGEDAIFALQDRTLRFIRPAK